MKIVASTFILLCVIMISAVFANDCKKEKGCNRIVCKDKNVKCPAFNCGGSKACNQLCINRKCDEMNCDAKEECKQFSVKGGSKMICSSNICKQTCSDGKCDLECTSSVKNCTQICSPGSTCKVTCDKDKSDCQQVCTNATCTGLPEEAKTIISNDVSGNCTVSCTSGCKSSPISCGSGCKRCFVSCNGGCTMECDSGVEECHQKCIGDKSCTSVCKAKRCSTDGAFHTSAAMVSQFNNLLFVMPLLPWSFLIL